MGVFSLFSHTKIPQPLGLTTEDTLGLSEVNLPYAADQQSSLHFLINLQHWAPGGQLAGREFRTGKSRQPGGAASSSSARRALHKTWPDSR